MKNENQEQNEQVIVALYARKSTKDDEENSIGPNSTR